MNICKKYEYIFNEVFKIINSKQGVMLYHRYLILFNNKLYTHKILEGFKKDWNNLYKKIKNIRSNIKIIIKSKQINRNKIYNGLFFIYNCFKNIKSPKTYIKEIKNIINHPQIYDIIYYLFFILSNIARCEYMILNKKSIKIKDKKELNKFLKLYKDEFPFIKEYITNIIPGNKNKWGYGEYSTACSMYYTLIFINKFYLNPLKKLGINLIYTKRIRNKKIILNNLEKELNKNGININKKNYNEIIIDLKKLGYNMWFVIELLFKNIYINYKINNIPAVKIDLMRNVGYQENNNILGIMCYLLVKDKYINNTTIFKNFNK